MRDRYLLAVRPSFLAFLATALLFSGCNRPPSTSQDHPEAAAPATEDRAVPQTTATTEDRSDSRSSEPSPGPDASADVLPDFTPEMPTTARELVQVRAQYDRTTWKHEVEAQRYEGTFVTLWDQLIFQTDKYKVLRDFPFGELRIGKSLSSQETDWGITISQFADPQLTITADAWPEFLDHFQQQGYEIIETEWHHQKFEPAEGGRPAKSIVSTLIHVNHPPTQRRFIVKGNLNIEWATKPRTERSPTSNQTRYISARPASIDASELTIVERQGEPAFTTQSIRELRRTQRESPRQQRLIPLFSAIWTTTVCRRSSSAAITSSTGIKVISSFAKQHSANIRPHTPMPAFSRISRVTVRSITCVA